MKKRSRAFFYNDNILSSALSQMRLNLYSPVSGLSGTAGDTGQSYNQLAQIGLTTSSDYTAHGKLVIDESTLKAAISADPDGVMKLFTQSGTDSSSQGIAKRLYNTLSDTISQVKQAAGTTAMADNQYDLGQSIGDMNTKISNFTDQLKDVQNRYYSEFTAMEQAIEQANTQSAYLSKI
ncbi:flagellar filament capping protein FliD [Terrilactibacillus sp. S3-3]|nr:flagellar filament capping protein FliD [Terrilactibacillus sp. S3-3]